MPEAAPSLRRAFSLLRMPRFRALLLVAGALSLATASDAFIFLALQEELDLGNSLFPLLFVGSAGTYMVLAAPFGRLADRVGRGRVLLAGYALLGPSTPRSCSRSAAGSCSPRRWGCSAPTTRPPTAC